MTFQLTKDQQQLVKVALDTALDAAPGNNANPNKNGNALYWLCENYLASEKGRSE